MKKYYLRLLLLPLSLGLISCSNTSSTAFSSTKDDISSSIGLQESTTIIEDKTLVSYFSWSSSGNTERMANYIKDSLNADIYEIIPAVAYPTEYTPTTEVARVEKDNNERPEIKDPLSLDDVKHYSKVFIGFPIWWHTAPMIIGTFLESYEFEGVDIYPFFQGASNSNNSYFVETMEFLRSCNDKAVIHDGLYASSSNTTRIDEYLESIE